MKIQILFVAIALLLNSTAYSQEMLNDYIMKLDGMAKKSNYGYSEKNPIKVGGMKTNASNNIAFLNALRGPNGEKVLYQRLGSCCAFKTKNGLFDNTGLLDRYEIMYTGLKEPIVLYLNMYDYDKPQCPQGFTYYTADELPKVETMPEEDIKKVTPCNADDKYSVEDMMLKDAIGEGYSEPDSYPEYDGGLDKLKEYFKQHPLADDRASTMVFRVAIGFMVNCNGDAGNYTIVTQGKGDMEELANQVLRIVNELPSNWLPAKVKKQAVDSYQILSFTVFGGMLDKVSYRSKK